MDFRDSPEEAAFREALRIWLAEHHPGPTPLAEDDRNAFEKSWHQSLYAGGWMGLSWPAAYGGHDRSPVFEAILNDESGLAGAPAVPSIGYLGRAMLEFGTEAQKRRFLPGLLSGDVTWCQGFSEPDAGSDLASLRTRADRTDGGYLLTGQKLWTSKARWSDWCLVLARTDPDVPKHKGISCLVVEMSAPGVDVRPIKQIWGDLRFAEVFFDSTPVPEDQRIGAEGDGWTIAMRTVAFERGPADIGNTAKYRRSLKELEDQAAAGRFDRFDDVELRLARTYVDVEVLRLNVLRSLSARAAGRTPGPESSIDKLLMIRTEQDLLHTAADLLGSALLTGQEPLWLVDYFWSRACSIYGGTEQIQKNIVATRVLGLPAR